MATYEKLDPAIGVFRPSSRGAGIITLQSDEQIEAGLAHLLAGRVRYYTTRARYEDEGESGDRFDVVGGLSSVVESLPHQDSWEVLAFACTSGPISLGLPRFLQMMEAAAPGKRTTVTALAVDRALDAAQVRNLAVLTPYWPALHARVVQTLEKPGRRVVASASFELNDDSAVGRISPDTLAIAGRQLVRSSGADCLFISCGAFDVSRSMQMIADCVDVPVVASCPAIAWDVARILEVDAGIPPAFLPGAHS